MPGDLRYRHEGGLPTAFHDKAKADHTALYMVGGIIGAVTVATLMLAFLAFLVVAMIVGTVCVLAVLGIVGDAFKR